MGSCLARFFAFSSALEGALAERGHGFAWHPTLGYVTTCPSALGAALRVIVTLRLPTFATPQWWSLLKRACEKVRRMGCCRPPCRRLHPLPRHLFPAHAADVCVRVRSCAALRLWMHFSLGWSS